jgi:hypothetical protein
MLRPWQSPVLGHRDLRIDWLRGLVMTCVIIDHSKISSLLTWVTYERFWTVTAAEVFVVLSGVVLGMVYGRKLNRGDWFPVIRGLAHRALTLYLAFLAVTLSVVVLGLIGIDVRPLTTFNDQVAGFVELLDPQRMGAQAWRDIALMRSGPWAFQIIGLYVWLVAAAVPCLFALRFAGWRPVLALSWGLYLWYRLSPHALTTGQFEVTFPILAWQLLFVHGVVIGYHRERIAGLAARVPRIVPIAVTAASVLFIVFALSNPWTDGPLHWDVVSADRFTDLYFRYFTLTNLGIGRVLNLAVALPVGYALLTAAWRMASPLGAVFVTLGQQSLGAFVLHVYGILLIAHMPLAQTDGLWINTLIQISLVLAIAVLLKGMHRWKLRRPSVATTAAAPARPLAA